MIFKDYSTPDENAGGVAFSELHGSTMADINGDGIQDFIVGKRLWSHHESFLDPDPYGAPVLYAYLTVRDPKAPGGARFVPELINNASGAGSQVVARRHEQGRHRRRAHDRRQRLVHLLRQGAAGDETGNSNGRGALSVAPNISPRAQFDEEAFLRLKGKVAW